MSKFSIACSLNYVMNSPKSKCIDFDFDLGIMSNTSQEFINELKYSREFGHFFFTTVGQGCLEFLKFSCIYSRVVWFPGLQCFNIRAKNTLQQLVQVDHSSTSHWMFSDRFHVIESELDGNIRVKSKCWTRHTHHLSDLFDRTWTLFWQ